jgi:putative sugar O-methyltransferase
MSTPSDNRDHPLASVGRNEWDDYARILRHFGLAAENEITFIREIQALGYFSQFSALANRRIVEKVCEWYVARLRAHGVNLSEMSPAIGESPATRTEVQVELDGRTISPDFLRCIWYVHTLEAAGVAMHDLGMVLEIGSGYGQLARLLKLTAPTATIVLVDLADSLVVSRAFLNQSFPHARVLCLPEDGAADKLSDYDFVLVEHDSCDLLLGHAFDLAINTWSFGEMAHSTVARYFDLLQRDLRVDTLFTVNRCPTLLQVDASNRHKNGDWLVSLDDRWDVLHFEFDPPEMRCPYLTVAPRLLSLIARRSTDIATMQEAARRDLADVVDQDWVIYSILDTVDPYRIPPAERRRLSSVWNFDERIGDDTVFDAEKYSAALDNRLVGVHVIDGGMGGTLFKLWNAVRLLRTPLATRLMRLYLRLLRGQTAPGLIYREEYWYGSLQLGHFARDSKFMLPNWFDALYEGPQNVTGPRHA